MSVRFATGLLLLAAGAVLAQTPDPAPGRKPPEEGLKLRMSEVELGGTSERLTNNQPDWRSLYLEGVHRFRERQAIYGGLRTVDRFGLSDSESWLGYYHPLDQNWTLNLEGSMSPQHNVLPEYSLYGQLSRKLPYGWIANAGLRHSEYTRSAVNMLVLGAERYWGNWRGGYTIYTAQPEGAPSGSAHRFQVDYYYGDRSSIGLSVTGGKEVENVGPPRGVITTDVRDLPLTGRHWFSPQWGLSWDVVAHEQGDLYRRYGVRLGLRHSF